METKSPTQSARILCVILSAAENGKIERNRVRDRERESNEIQSNEK